MKHLIKILILKSLVLTTIFFQSCDKEDVTMLDPSNPQAQEAVSVTDGRLVFASQVDFEATMQELTEMQETIGEWEAQFNGFTSIREAYSKVTNDEMAEIAQSMEPGEESKLFTWVRNEDEEWELRDQVPVAVLASVVNENGIFQIGDRVFRVTYDKAFEAPVSSIAQLALDNPEGAPGVITHEVERRPLNQHNFTIKTCNNNYQYGGLKRFRGEMLFNNYPWGQFLGIRVRHQAKGIGWFAYNASTLHMNFNGQITVNGNIAYDGNYSCGYRSNAATFTHLLYYCSSSMSPCYITLAVNVNYAGRGIDGVWRSCATN